MGTAQSAVQSLQAHIRHQDWTFRIQGRIDQLLPDADTRILREVKTVNCPLPAPAEELADRYPDYLPELPCIWDCCATCRTMPTRTAAELQFIDITDGCAQTIRLTKPTSRYTRQLDALSPTNDGALPLRLDRIAIQPAFARLRLTRRNSSHWTMLPSGARCYWRHPPDSARPASCSNMPCAKCSPASMSAAST